MLVKFTICAVSPLCDWIMLAGRWGRCWRKQERSSLRPQVCWSHVTENWRRVGVC